MPNWAVALRDHLVAKNCSGPLALAEKDVAGDYGLMCIVCKAVLDEEVLSEVWGIGRASFRCHHCACAWHADCAAFLAGARANEVKVDAFVCPHCLGCL